jgi:peptidoglycan lytic transglycosylase G
VSGGYGPGGYPGQGYGPPDYEGDPGRTRPGRPGGPRGGYQGPGYGSQDFDGRPYDGQAYDDYGDQGNYADPGYDPRGYGQPAGPDGGYRYPQGGPQAPGYGTGGQPVQRGTGPRRAAGGYDQGSHGDWEQEQRDDSFMPGFGGRGGYDSGRAQERDGRYGYDDGYGAGYDDRRGPRGGGQAARGPDGPGGPGGRDDGRDWYDRDARSAKPRKKATRWLPRILVLVIVGAIVIGGLVGGLDVYHKYEARYHPADYVGQGTGEVTVQVMSGDTAFSLAPRLLQLGVIASTRAFTNAAENTGSTTTSASGLEAGFYLLHHHMQASLAYAALLNPKNLVQTTVTIPEGLRAVDVIAAIAKKTKIPLKDFQQVLANPAQLGLPSYAGGKAEGYLFPATYAIVPHETALQILQAMVQRFNVEAQAISIEAAAKSVGLTPAQLITEASLAQSEGGSVSDYPKIAEVINNRLAKGMHLQFDSTVLYGLGKYAVSATFKQINTPGPYNTYLNAGLPPGPISNPGDAAIQGVLHAEHGDYLYFLTVPGGKSQFSLTPLKGQ